MDRERKPGDDAAAADREAQDAPSTGQPSRQRYGALATAMRKAKAAGDQPSMNDVATAAVDGKDAGSPVDGGVRAKVEAHLGADLSSVRVHSDPLAQQSSEAIGARAFTHGSDVFLGPGESGGDVGLMAHELTHVVQQGAAGEAVQRQVQVGSSSSPAEAQADAVAAGVTGGAPPLQMLVDSGPVQEGQMLKDAFMRELREQVTSAANDELGLFWSAVGCPYIDSFFSRHQSSDAATIDRLARRYSRVSQPRSARDYIGPIVTRVREGVRRWRAGEDVSADLSAAGMGEHAADAQRTQEQNRALEENPQAAQRMPAGDARPSQSTPAELSASLGSGQPLDATTEGRMSEAFGESFSDVRIHTDTQAARKASQESAAAFAVGTDVVFGAGQYRPGTPVGDAMLAHELAHVSQQRGAAPEAQRKPVGSESSAHEADADRATVGVMRRLYDRSSDVVSDRVGPALSSGYQLQRCDSNQMQTGARELEGASENGRFEGEAVGQHEMSTSGSFSTHTLNYIAEETLGFEETEGAAIALAKAGGSNGGAVSIENGRYVAYRVRQWIPSDRPETFLEQQSGIIHHGPVQCMPGVVAIITNDGVVLRPGEFAPGGTGTQDATGSASELQADPFQGYREAFGDDSGSLADVDRDRLLLAFNAAMRDNALQVLARSEQEVRAKQEMFGGGTSRVSSGEIGVIRQTLTDLVEIQGQIDDAETQAAPLTIPVVPPSAGGGMGGGFFPLPPALAPESGVGTIDHALEGARRAEQLKQRRRVIVANYPILARYRTSTELQRVAGLTNDDALLTELGGQMPGILTSIEETRNNVLNGSFNLWKVPPLIESTMAGLGITEASQRQWIEEEKEARARAELRDTLILTAFEIGFGVGAAFVGGPVGLAMAAGAFGLGVYDALQATDQYFVDQHASNTHMDPSMSLLPPELAAGWGWLVVAWVGVLIDAGDVANAIGDVVRSVARAERSIADAADVLARQTGAEGDEATALAERLRRAAGDFDPDELINPANKAALANRIGTSIEIDSGLPEGAVRIYYQVNEQTGEIVVLGCKASPAAQAADVVAHAGVVRLLQRYNGVSGRFRQLWDRFREIIGAPNPNVPPSSLQRGSAGWESFHELGKYREMIQGRTERLGSELTEAQEGQLRADIEFFESEYRHHEEVMRQLADEAGSGFIARAGVATKDALDRGYRLPDFPNATRADIEADPTILQRSNYYYRPGSSSDQFTLVKKANRQADSLRGNPDGTFSEGTLTRSERATQLVASWGDEASEAFDEFAEQMSQLGHRAVPVRGMSATGKTMGEVITEFGPSDFQSRFMQILVEAQTRRGVAEDVATANATEALGRLTSHEITVVQGTDQLRAFGYRSHYMATTGTTMASGEDLHHLIPLYLGGDHLVDNFVRLQEDLHQRMHTLIDEVGFDEATSLAPSSIQRAALTFDRGVAILKADGSIEMLPMSEVVRRMAQSGGGG